MPWLRSLKTDTPEDGFQLALKMGRMAVNAIQPDDSIRGQLRDDCANNADTATLASQVVAINFQTIAEANNYWMDD